MVWGVSHTCFLVEIKRHDSYEKEFRIRFVKKIECKLFLHSFFLHLAHPNINFKLTS